MKRLSQFSVMVCLVLVCGLPVRASAQDVPIDKAVHVTTSDGTRYGGTLVSLDTKTVVIYGRKGTASFPLTEVRIVTRDSSAIAAGTAVGLGVGLFGGLMLCAHASDCSMGQAMLMTAGIGAGVGAGAGALIKYLRSDSRVVYRAPGQKSISVSPVVGRKQVGVRGVIVW